MKNWVKEFENFKLDRDAKPLETERRSIEFSGGLVAVPALARVIPKSQYYSFPISSIVPSGLSIVPGAVKRPDAAYLTKDRFLIVTSHSSFPLQLRLNH